MTHLAKSPAAAVLTSWCGQRENRKGLAHIDGGAIVRAGSWDCDACRRAIEAQARALCEILTATPLGSESVRIEAQLGCGNMPCDTARPRGMHTNGRCHCDEATVRRAALAWREYALSLEARLCGGPAR